MPAPVSCDPWDSGRPRAAAAASKLPKKGRGTGGPTGLVGGRGDRRRGGLGARRDGRRNLWSLGAAAGPPRSPGIPGSAVSQALVSRRSWRVGPVQAPLWKDRTPFFPKRCWDRSGTPRTATDQPRRNRDPGDGGAVQAPRFRAMEGHTVIAGVPECRFAVVPSLPADGVLRRLWELWLCRSAGVPQCRSAGLLWFCAVQGFSKSRFGYPLGNNILTKIKAAGGLGIPPFWMLDAAFWSGCSWQLQSAVGSLQY
eukprot:gene16446-biopygen6767